MDGERIVLGATEQRRAVVLNRVLSGAWTRGEAAVALGRSERQVRRLLAAYAAQGPGALVHGNRGRAPANTLAAAVRERVVALARTTYAGCNDTHLAELLAEREGLAVSRPTVRRWRRAAAAAGLAGAGSPRSRRPPKHRKRRERAAREGLLLQADGSPHRWLGPAGPEWTLLAGIDDATGAVPWAVFREQEDAAGYMLWLRRVVETRGVPVALYVDRHGVFRRQKHLPLTLEEELAGGPLPTQFGRVLAELGIRVIHALSPQAKGRVERLFGTLQDRLVAELRLAGVRTLDEANRALARFLPAFNARFAVPPAQPGSAYRPLAEVLAPEAALDEVICFKYPRIAGADNAVRFFGHRLQLLPGPARRSYARARVEVHEHLDGSLAVYHQAALLTARPAPAEAPLLRARRLRRYPELPAAPPPDPAPAAPAPPPPPATHPWRQKRIVDTRVPFPDRPTWR
jgi:transposase